MGRGCTVKEKHHKVGMRKAVVVFRAFTSISTTRVISKTGALKKGQYKICADGTQTYNPRITP